MQVRNERLLWAGSRLAATQRPFRLPSQDRASTSDRSQPEVDMTTDALGVKRKLAATRVKVGTFR